MNKLQPVTQYNQWKLGQYWLVCGFVVACITSGSNCYHPAAWNSYLGRNGDEWCHPTTRGHDEHDPLGFSRPPLVMPNKNFIDSQVKHNRVLVDLDHQMTPWVLTALKFPHHREQQKGRPGMIRKAAYPALVRYHRLLSSYLLHLKSTGFQMHLRPKMGLSTKFDRYDILIKVLSINNWLCLHGHITCSACDLLQNKETKCLSSASDYSVSLNVDSRST